MLPSEGLSKLSIVSHRTAKTNFFRYARQDSYRVTATSSTNNVSVAAWIPQTASFPAGGNLAMQIINNANAERSFPISIDGLQLISNYTVLLLNNDFNLAKNHSLFVMDGTNITATIPPTSMVVFALDAIWS